MDRFTQTKIFMPMKCGISAIILIAYGICYGAGNGTDSVSKETLPEMAKRNLPKQTTVLSREQCDSIFTAMKSFCTPTQMKSILLLQFKEKEIFFTRKGTDQCIFFNIPNGTGVRRARSCSAIMAVDYDENRIELGDEAFNQLLSLIYDDSNRHKIQAQPETEIVGPSSVEPEVLISRKTNEQSLTIYEMVAKATIDIIINGLGIWSNLWSKHQGMKLDLMQKVGEKLIDGVSSGANKVMDRI
ncbi:MAG: hypothetical protein LBJ13_00285 [Puniceicoccales bacterium]|jgi:hypothetical protein|nr:hypothetical protein [Puniceicoccales bacterium]